MDRLLTINEWLDALGIDRAYKKDMKRTYNQALAELQAQDVKTLKTMEDLLNAHISGYLDDKGVKKGYGAAYKALSTFREALKQGRMPK